MDAPPHIHAVLSALRFSERSILPLESLDQSEWSRLLEWCDARQLTLLLHCIWADHLPPMLRAQMEERRRKYALRFQKLKQELFTITEALNRAGLDFCILKGFTHAPVLTEDPLTRAQGDIDLWMEPISIPSAKKILLELGYVPILAAKSRHIDPMARPTAWRWRGDRFDPEMPISVEVHYELWSAEAERIAVPEQVGFWSRRIIRDFDGRPLPVLRDEDLIGFAALHLLLHILHGELPLQRAWEIGNFLHRNAANESFWRSWRETHPVGLRRIETLIFRMVANWFGCDWPGALDPELRSLSPAVNAWLERFDLSPLKREWQPNKDELWLHLALIPDFRSKLQVFLRRLLPVRGKNLEMSRVAHHAWTLLPTIVQGFRWRLRSTTSAITLITRSR